jgi:putative ABC transport system permease protein
MFFTYLRRELRRRMRQAVLIAIGLAVGIGLVITVTAASAGVSDAQDTVLHSLYGIGTDLTVTTAAPKGSGSAPSVSFGDRPTAGSSFSKNMLISSSSGLGPIKSSSVTRIADLQHVAAASGALALTDLALSGTVPSLSGPGGGGGAESISTNSFTVLGVDTSQTGTGPLSSATLTSGRAFTSADANQNVALVDADYASANKLTPGSVVSVGNSAGGATNFQIVGILQAPPGTTPYNVDIPLARAQALGAALSGSGSSGLADEVNIVYVSADSAANIAAVQHEISALLPAATVTTASDLASQVTGSASSAATLINELGRWLAIAVLAAAFLLAALLTMAAVARRVREFGTLKALGWSSRRIVAQVMGESITIGLLGGAAGISLGYAGSTAVDKAAPKLSATVDPTSLPGGSRTGGAIGNGTIRNALSQTAHTVSVHLSAPVTVRTIVLAVVLAIAGGLLSGAFGGWRAARLRPAAAMTRVE